MYQTVKVTTDNVLRRCLEGEYMGDTIVLIDEAHTNDIQMYEQLAYVRRLSDPHGPVPKQNRPYIIILSASIDAELFAQYCNTDFIIEITGSRFPVQHVYLDKIKEYLPRNADLPITVAHIVRMIALPE